MSKQPPCPAVCNTPWRPPPDVWDVSHTCDVTYCTLSDATATRLAPFMIAESTTSMTGAPQSAACKGWQNMLMAAARRLRLFIQLIVFLLA